MGVAAAIGAVATLGGAAIASSGAKSAANTQAQAAQSGVAEQQREFDINQANYAPWLAAGKDALSGQLNLLGLGTGGADGQQAAIDQLKASPLYQSLYRNGQDTLLNNAAATGGLRGGNTQHALANFGADTLSQVIQQQLANLGGISGNGMTSAGNLGQLNGQSANAISNLLTQQGSAKAGGILGSTGIWNNAFNGISSQLGGIFQNGGFGGSSGSSSVGSPFTYNPILTSGGYTPTLSGVNVPGAVSFGI